MLCRQCERFFFFFNDTATTEIYTLSLHDALPISFLIFFSLFQPIIFLLLFTQLFSRFAGVPGFPAENYLLFAVPGIILQNSFTSAFQSGTAIVDDLKSGFLAKMLATQVNRQAILLGRIAADSARVAVQSLIIFSIRSEERRVGKECRSRW